MQKLISTLLLLLIPTLSQAANETYAIDPTHTYPNFTINHLGFSTMHGRFGKTSGTITMDRAQNKGSVDILIDAESINTGMKKRDDHLRSPDFLNAMEFPSITYQSNKVTFTQSGATVDGKLTIMGVSKATQLTVDSINCGLHPMDPTKKKYVCGFNAIGKIKRSDFGVTYGIPAIGDEMTLSIEVEAVRQ